MGMIFVYEGRAYEGGTAAEIVRALAHDSAAAEAEMREVRAYVEGALERLADRVHLRDRATSRHLSDEAIAFNFLCLLDEYGIGRFDASASGTRAP